MPDLLARAEEGARGLDPWRAANLREMRRSWVHQSALPAELVEARTRATSACEMAWREARKNNDFRSLLPTLSEVLAIMRRVGEAKAAALGTSALRRAARRVRAGRPRPAHRRAVRRAARLPAWPARPRHGTPAARAPAACPRRPVSGRPQQCKLGEDLIRLIGFDFTHGRLDVSAHPFTGGTADDVRITTRYDEADFARALMGVLHETGHGLYEAGLPRDLAAPAGRPCARHGAARKPVAADGDAGLPQRRFPLIRRPAHARRLRAEGRPGRPTTSIVSIRASRRASSASTPTR